MNAPLVSIITPAFNSAKFIAETIRSVQNQTHKNWEMIIVDDCSTDETINIIKQFSIDQRIKLIQLEKNSGAGIARNAGLSAANGRYIAFLDADDLWLSPKLEKQLQWMNAENLPFTFSFYNCVDEDGKDVNRIVKSPETLTEKQLFWSNWVGNLTGIYDSEFFGKIKIESSRKRQDWRMWQTIIQQIKQTKPVPEVLATYRIRKNSVSSSKLNLIKHNYNVYRQFHGKSAISAAFCMIKFLYVHFFVKSKYIRKA